MKLAFCKYAGLANGGIEKYLQTLAMIYKKSGNEVDFYYTRAAPLTHTSWIHPDNDLKRIKYIKKLVTRYVEKGDLKERLILNHIIVLNNCFGAEITAKILFLKLKSRLHYIKPFLIFLNILPERLYNVGGEKIIDTNMVSMDQEIINRLRKIGKGDEENI